MKINHQILLLFASVILFSSPSFSQELQISQLDIEGDYGCVQRDNRNAISVKGRFGSTELLSVKVASKRIKRASRYDRKEKKELLKLFRECRRGYVTLPIKEDRSFKFYCEQGYYLPSISEGGDKCGINISSLNNGLFNYEAVIGILDWTLTAECEDDGGQYYRPVYLELFFPLYYGVCLYNGEQPTSDNSGIGFLPQTLGMEEEAPDCFKLSGQAEDDPCEEMGNGPSGGGTGKSTPKPSPEEDCLVMRMEEEAADC